MAKNFEDVSPAEIQRFAAENPLVWIVPAADPSMAILMPVLMEPDDHGLPFSILGHLPRLAPICSLLQTDPRATCLFLGPHAYISPAWISKQDWAPTWNFLSLKVSGCITLDDTLTQQSVRRLAEHMESQSGSDWAIDQVGARLQPLMSRIIGFRMEIETLTPRFKTGQDENETSRREIYAALEGHPLQAWIT